ncbi:RNA pyrophosphohydrolase [Blochmannia endosymbiont of Camponotus (Colobopsis) obliquus]|uniref:RNA pyrophosphohydrolase n=1 Tax=Blochmannia endosymbiont of Camponotus (Colobopsis) obliquus TaxID=1505597 RepID=UPI00061A7761|nr:RNA pyrophosphohydrolase [Blochmannia endosymbiont of Camponotus (Colobopsis) obliquus]AKC60430.1 RNA pyrophosphohydrolase [Blochmannia endosymbiont of Camponotus (Colobopsis) obliquus]
MIDENGYRQNVGIVICNFHRQVLWARRYGEFSWQFPQGGIKYGETAEEAMYRELFEEVGLNRNDVRMLSSIRYWLSYKLPKRLIRRNVSPMCIGQKQKWFLLQLICQDALINLNKGGSCEFDDWRWVSFWYPVNQIVIFKRHVYRKVLKEFSNVIIQYSDD